jgi:hypothetical protein
MASLPQTINSANQGFKLPWSQIPNLIIDHWMPVLKASEFKVLMYFARQIYGFHRATVRTGYTRIAEATGLDFETVQLAVCSLHERGPLVLNGGAGPRKGVMGIYAIDEVRLAKIPKSNLSEFPIGRAAEPIGNSDSIKETVKDLKKQSSSSAPAATKDDDATRFKQEPQENQSEMAGWHAALVIGWVNAGKSVPSLTQSTRALAKIGDGDQFLRWMHRFEKFRKCGPGALSCLVDEYRAYTAHGPAPSPKPEPLICGYCGKPNEPGCTVHDDCYRGFQDQIEREWRASRLTRV